LQAIDLTSLSACQYKDEIGDSWHVVPYFWHYSIFSQSEYEGRHSGNEGKFATNAFIVKQHPKRQPGLEGRKPAKFCFLESFESMVFFAKTSILATY